MVDKKNIKPVIEVVNAIDSQTSVDASRRQFFKHTIAGAFGAAAALNMMPAGLKIWFTPRAQMRQRSRR